jgi:hypothetical protein
VVTDAESVVVAYVTLSMTGIDRSSAPAAVAKQSPDPVPALLIGRLAVDRSVSGLGVGTALVAHVLATAVDLNQWAACRAVVVTALDESARSWWEQLRFHSFDPTDHNSLDLYLLTADIQARLDSLGDEAHSDPSTRPRVAGTSVGACRVRVAVVRRRRGTPHQCAWTGPDDGGVPANARF